MDPLKRSKYAATARNALISGIITSFFMYLVYFRGWQSLAAGMFIGGLIYVAMVFYSGFISDRYLRKMNLLLVLAINTFSTLLIMLAIAWLGVGVFYLKGDFRLMIDNIGNLFGYYYLIGMVFGFVMSISFNFISIVNTLVGRNVLGRLFIGRYRHPFEVERVFMFIDIKSSTTIAEATGPKKFMSLVNDFFHDIALPAAETKGEIYKYVGDEVIITWKTEEALQNANCLRCFAGIEARIRAKTGYYLNTYGLVPEFKAGVHGGTVITGELGYTRREIAYMGDVLNTTARIEESCKKHGVSLLVSETVMNGLALPDGMTARKVGKEVLRGKSEEIELVEVITSGYGRAG